MNDDEYEDEDDCTYDEDGECDDPYCEKREMYIVEETRTVRYVIRAHTEDEADTIMWNFQPITVEEPPSDGSIDEFEDDGPEYTIQSETEYRADQQRWREMLAAQEAEEVSP